MKTVEIKLKCNLRDYLAVVLISFGCERCEHVRMCSVCARRKLCISLENGFGIRINKRLNPEKSHAKKIQFVCVCALKKCFGFICKKRKRSKHFTKMHGAKERHSVCEWARLPLCVCGIRERAWEYVCLCVCWLHSLACNKQNTRARERERWRGKNLWEINWNGRVFKLLNYFQRMVFIKLK